MAFREPLKSMLCEETSVHTGLSWLLHQGVLWPATLAQPHLSHIPTLHHLVLGLPAPHSHPRSIPCSPFEWPEPWTLTFTVLSTAPEKSRPRDTASAVTLPW